MRALRYLYRNINLLNIILLLLIIAVIIFAILPLFRMKVKYMLPLAKAKTVEQQAVAKETAPPTSPADYMVISENNLFHPERKIPPEKKDEKALPKPELVLYGTVIGDGMSVAYIEDKKSPKSTPGRGKRQSVVKKGDVLGGFVLKDIETDRIVLSRGEEVMVVRLTEAGKQREPVAGHGKLPGAGPTPMTPSPAGVFGAAAPRVAPSPVALPSASPPGPTVAPSPAAPVQPGLSLRQQRLQQVQELKAARPMGQ